MLNWLIDLFTKEKLHAFLHGLLTIGGAAMGFQLLIIFLGYPTQIFALWRAQDSSALSFWFVALPIPCHVLWAIHGRRQRDWAIFVPQLPGLFFAISLFILYMRYL